MASPRAPSIEPLPVSILSQGPYLIVSIHTGLDDEQLKQLQHELIDRVGRQRCRGILVDVAAVDLLDSFATRTLSDLGHMARLRGAETVVVGIAPEVALAMVQLSLQMPFVRTALDLEEGLACLADVAGPKDAGPAGERHGRG